tara:strand:- start:243 stop:743 length:501 start_codon:yes stop_codon:yes gene_type:complete
MSAKEKYIQLYQEMADLCEQEGWGDPFSYARSKEIYAACVLGHRMPGPSDYSGADAINEHGEEVEYKSTIGKSVKGSYTGISVQPTWQQQDKYLREEKLAKYPEHFYNRFDGGKLVESWKLTGQQVYEILLPKLRKKYPTILQKKDPRLSADITTGDLKQHGIRVL